MKKIIFSLIIFISFPISILAANYEIESYYIDAIIKENGNMEVSELILMDGTFNGYEVGIEYNTGDVYSASNLTDVYIGAKTNIKKISFDMLTEDFVDFDKVSYANNGDKLKYIEMIEYNKNTYRMYNKTNNSSTLFLFKYTLKDVVIMHNDCAEVYWNFFSNEFSDDINDLQIRVRFPKSLNKEEFHWWFHGPLAGSSDFYDNRYVLAKLDFLEANNPVDFRVLMPKEMFSESLIVKKDNDNVKESIIAYEDEIVEKDLALIKEIRLKYYATVVLTIFFYVILIIMWVYVYIKYDKERKAKFQNKYNREFIDDYNVEVIDYLMNRNITPNAMSASIMNLIYKKNISYEKIEDGKKNSYTFILENKDNLNETEIILVDFLFGRVGNGKTFTTTELKKYASSTKTCDEFMSSFTKWKNKVISDGKNELFFETNKNKAIYGLIIFMLALLIVGVASFNNVIFNPAYFTIFFAIIFIIYIAAFSKKTEKGIEHYAQWIGFKNFLNDFGTFELKELPEIVLWERYLVYATIFGLADKVEKAMNVRIKELNVTNNNVYIPNHIHIAPALNSSIRSAYNGAQAAVTRANANASGGSFGGHGGGFSSGGGFGGGGRSGGGF